jgi:two-component system chemotaxis response regulator CheY
MTASILIVDDNAMMRSVMRVALARAGYDVTLAEDGAKALAKLSDGKRFDLIITDLEMPILDGAGLVGALRRASCSSPVLLISGRVGGGELARLASSDLAVQGSLEKPFTGAKLISKVAELLC